MNLELDNTKEKNFQSNNEELNNFKQLLEKNINLNEQNNIKKDGNTYKVIYLEDDCEDGKTILQDTKTGEVFNEKELSHDVYHQVGVGSLLMYTNGNYKIVEGTSVYDLYPNEKELYCEKQDVYYTKDGKVKTLENNNVQENKFEIFVEKIKKFIHNIFKK